MRCHCQSVATTIASYLATAIQLASYLAIVFVIFCVGLMISINMAVVSITIMMKMLHCPKLPTR